MWVLLSAVENIVVEEKLPSIQIKERKVIGSWRAFSRETSHAETVKCKLEYFLVAPLPPHDNIMK